MYDEKYKFFWKQFEDHELTEERPGQYIWKNPKTYTYCVFIQFSHGHILIYGDLGPFAFNPGAKDPFSWARTSIGSMDYVLGKTRPYIGRLYDSKATYNHLKEMLIDDYDDPKEYLNTLEERKNELSDPDDALSLIVHFEYTPDELCHTWAANPGAMWAYWSLRTFIDKLKETS